MPLCNSRTHHNKPAPCTSPPKEIEGEGALERSCPAFRARKICGLSSKLGSSPDDAIEPDGNWSTAAGPVETVRRALLVAGGVLHDPERTGDCLAHSAPRPTSLMRSSPV